MHLDDDAELYALGLLEPDRDAAIEAHLAVCAACRTRVVAAEAVAASLAAALPPLPAAAAASAPGLAHAIAPRRAWSVLAVAAALVFAVTAAIEGAAAHAASARLALTDGALLAVAGSHFNHVTLTGPPGLVAKALYARDGAWCYVVARGVPPGAHVVLRTGSTARDAGALDGDDPATLFVRAPGRADEIELVVGERAVARAVPAY